MQAKYPSLTPYNFVANSPIVLIDPDGKDNVIYLVVTNKQGKASIKLETAIKIRNEANLIYEKLGLNTRVVVYENKTPFNTESMDKTDAVAVLGNSKKEAQDYIEKNISKSFAKILKENEFSTSINNPELSQNEQKKGGNIIAVGYEATKDFYSWDTGGSNEQEVAFTIVHGAGHNATENHDPTSGIMTEGNDLKWNRYKIKNLLGTGLNENLIKSMKKRFGTNPAQANYSQKEKESNKKGK